MWIARDKNGNLHIFERKPWRETAFFGHEASFWSNNSQATLVKDGEIRRMFYDLKWEDEPVEVELRIKKQPVPEDGNDTITLTMYLGNTKLGYVEKHEWFITMLKRQAHYQNYTDEQLEEVWQNHLKQEYSVNEIWDTEQCDGYTKLILTMGRHDNQHEYEYVCETKEYIDNKIKEICG